MIARLQGKVIERIPPFLVIDVSGIGFKVQAPLSSFEKIEIDKEIVIYTKCLIKEDEAFIYGFLGKDELSVFVDLISVSGVGPKLALNILSTFSPETVSQAIEGENLEMISSVPKIGRKLASKIVLELKGKLSLGEKPTIFNQAVHALCALGLSRGEAIQRLKTLPKDLSLEEMIKASLRQ
jgi:Holliday junction DNA helicase RuvA